MNLVQNDKPQSQNKTTNIIKIFINRGHDINCLSILSVKYNIRNIISYIIINGDN